MDILKKIGNYITEDDPENEEEQIELTPDEAQAVSAYESPAISNSSGISANTNIVLFEPRNFDEAEEIGYHIKQKRACCVNLHRMPSEFRQRIIDFLSGVVYGVDGSIKKIGDNVILCSPKNLQVGGDIKLND